MEPVFMATSQSAATAACLAIDDNVPVQKLDYAKLRERLLQDGQVLEWKAPAKPGTSTAFASEPFLEKRDLFTAGEGGYKIYHIPGIIVTSKGTVLSWCEARQTSGDWDQIEILLRRSTDEGKTWSAPRKIADVPGVKTKNPFSLAVKNVNPADVTYNNPVIIADRNGAVHMLFCLEYMRCFYQRSDDDGLSWSTPVEITNAFEKLRSDYDWKVLATGPVHGIQLKNGRLIVPVWLSTGTGGNAHRPSVSATIYSDDGGKTWQAGDIALPCTETWINPNETVAIELADGRVMLNARSESKAHRRLVTVSADGATGWSTPKFDDALLEPICMASIVRLSHASEAGRNRILFSNPDQLARADGQEELGKVRDRKNLTIKLSYDEAQTWPITKVLDPGYSSYSDLAVTKSGMILCLYSRGERGTDFGGYTFKALTLARFNLEWLTDGRDSLPSAR
jgi:sialidase-1